MLDGYDVEVSDDGVIHIACYPPSEAGKIVPAILALMGKASEPPLDKSEWSGCCC